MKKLIKNLNSYHKKKSDLPKTGNPNLNMSLSYVGASTAFTELGPPEIIIALK